MSAVRTQGPGVSTALERWAPEIERELSAGVARQVPKSSVEVRHHPKKPRESDAGWRRKERMEAQQGANWSGGMQAWERFSGARRNQAPIHGAVAIDQTPPRPQNRAVAQHWTRSAARLEEWAEDHAHKVGTDESPRLIALRSGRRARLV